MKYVKTFENYLNEGKKLPKDMEYDESVNESASDDKKKINDWAKKIESKIGAKLSVSYDEEIDDPEDADKDENTKSIYYQVIDPKNGLKKTMDPFLTLVLQNDGNFWFSIDASPISNSLYSSSETKKANQSLEETPKPIAKLNKKIYLESIPANLEDYY